MRPIQMSLVMVLAIMLSSCSREPVAVTKQGVPFDGNLGGHRIEHVVVIAIDGLEAGTLWEYLRGYPPKERGGLHDLVGVKPDGDGVVLTKSIAVVNGVTVFPSYTYPAWTSMFTGVYPGAHGITGNTVFFRDREIVRYYSEYHLDTLRVQLEKDFFSNDLNTHLKTLYQYVGEESGQSIVVHNMVSRGSEARKPSFDTLWSYKKNQSRAVDENTLWETVKSLEEFNKDKPTEFRLPTVLTIYFSGMDHAEHVTHEDPEKKAQQAYLGHLDGLIAKFIAGNPSIARHRFPTPGADPIQTDFLSWPGLQNNPAWSRTLVILTSDHGHTPIKWNDVMGPEDLKLMFKELSKKSGHPYKVEDPTFIDDSLWSKIRAVLGFLTEGQIGELTNIVPVLSGGSLGLHIKPMGGAWTHRADYVTEVVPVLEHLLLTLHKNRQMPEAVLYNRGDRYVFIPYDHTDSTISLLPGVDIARSPLIGPTYPMAVERLDGLAFRLPGDPANAPDLIFLADRSKGLSYSNKQDWRVLETVSVETHRHFHSDHGHLNASDSLVPMIFHFGGYTGQDALLTICQASVVDVTPTVLDILGKAQLFDKAVAKYPEEVKGHSLKKYLEGVLNHAPQDEHLCAARIIPAP